MINSAFAAARPSTRRWLAFPLAVLAVATMAACSSDEGDDASTDAPSGGDTVTTVAEVDDTVATTVADSASSDIEGTWTIDAGELLAANTANLGAAPAFLCTGPINMTFAEGTYTRGGEMTCTADSITGGGTLQSTGNYTVDGSTITVSNSVSSGSLTFDGATVPFSDSLGAGSYDYEVNGDSLKITFSDPSVGEVTTTYTRVA